MGTHLPRSKAGKGSPYKPSIDPMKQKLFFGIALFAIMFGCFPAFTNASTESNIIISEIAWAGSSFSSADEWIELTNMSNQSVDISGWSLSGASSEPLVFPAGSILNSYSTFLISNYANTNTNSSLNTQPQMVTTVVSLPNDKLTLTLTTPNGIVVDSAGAGGALFAGKSGGTGSSVDGRFRTMERINILMNGSEKEAWADADVSKGFKENTLDFGTPGVLNALLQAQQLANTPTVVASKTEPVVIEVAPIPTTVSESVAPEEPEAVCHDVVIDTDASLTSEKTSLEPTNDQESASIVVEQTTTPTTTQISLVDEQTSTSAEASVNGQSQPLQNISPPQGSLRISELYPHPTSGESEWVELENNSMYPVVTNGWSILDASNTVTTLPNGSVPPGAFIVIENPKGKLNNDGDSVILKNTEGSLVESVLYNADLGSVPSEGESLVRANANILTISITPTKNASNVFMPRPPKTTASTPNSNNTTTMEPAATNTETKTTAPTTQTVTTTVSASQSQPPQTQPVAILKTIRLSEFYPNTGGNDATEEFIEIENTGDQSVSLEEWILADANGTKFTFAKDAVIAAHTFKAFLRPETKISLNNDDETVTLTAPDGEIVDTQTYEQAKPALTYARTNNLWNWTTTRTPNEPNVVSGNSDPIPTTPPPAKTTTTNISSTAQSIGTITSSMLAIEQAKLKSIGTRVKIHGIVTVLPNTFNSQTMYVQDKTGGVQIFKSDCLFPSLTLGQSITVSGILSSVNGEARIKVTNQKSLVPGSVEQTLTPSTNSTSIGSLISIAGIVTSRSGNRLALDVDGNTMQVDLPKTTETVYTKGSNVQVSGVLTKTKSGTVLKTRSEQDVTTIPQESLETFGSKNTNTQIQEPKQTIAIVLILLSSLAFLGLKLRPKLYSYLETYGKQPLAPRTQKTT